MAVYSIKISLQSSSIDGGNIADEHFVKALAITSEDLINSVVSNRGKWATSSVIFPIIRLNDYANESEPSEVMFQKVRLTLNTIAGFLDRRPIEMMDSIKGRGLNVSLFIDVWMDQDQMELTLPPLLLKACGRHDLEIVMISNDISVDEV